MCLIRNDIISSSDISLKSITICAFAGLLIYSCIRFYEEPLPPSFRPFHSLYHSLHGNDPHPSFDRPFPQNEKFSFSGSTKVDTGENGPSVYARLSELAFTPTETGLVIVFYSGRFQNLPSIQALAPQPTIHVGGSVFPVREIAQSGQTSTEAQYALVFPPIGSLEDDVLTIYLDENKSYLFRVMNPTPPPHYSDLTGTNLWCFLIFVTLPGFIVTLIYSAKYNYLDRLADEWQKIDVRRDQAAKAISGIDEAESNRVRYRAAQISLDRAERIIMEFYEERLRDQTRIFWYSAALIFIVGGSAILLLSPISPLKLPGISALPMSEPQYGGLVERVRKLEAYRSATLFYMIITIILGLIGIAANLLLSIWRIKTTARKSIRKRIGDFEDIFDEKLTSKVAMADQTVRDLQARFAQILTKAQQAHDALTQNLALSATNKEILVEQELAEIKGIAAAFNSRTKGKQ